MKPIDEDNVLSRSRANGARGSRLRRASSAVTVLSAARKSSSRSSAATIRAHAAPRGRFKRCCLAQRLFFDGVNRDHYQR
jgi:hypothetical protein